MMDPASLEEARTLWSNQGLLEAGRLILDAIPDDRRPSWAAGILRFVMERSRIECDALADTLRIADDPSMWRTAKRQFDVLRDRTLELDAARRTRGLSKHEATMGYVLALAELVAKVTYNSTRPMDEFDEDSGWWVVACLRGFVDTWGDATAADLAWSALVASGAGEAREK